jgi:hypothetical protein
MTLPTGFQASTTNFMVPAAGQTHVVGVQGAPFGSPALVDWRQFNVDNFPFQPQGAYIDNTQSTTPVILATQPAGLTITVPAGAMWAVHWPAPNGQTTMISDPTAIGTDVTNIWFVDYPIIPFQISAASAAGANESVQVVSWTAAQDVLTNPTALAQGGVPYRTQEDIATAEYHYLSLSGATVTVNVTPTTPNQNLRKLRIYVTGDAAMAAAGDNLLTVTLNAIAIFERKFTLPAAAPATPGQGFTVCELDMDEIGLPAAAGALAVTISTALSVGQMDVNAYFTPQ